MSINYGKGSLAGGIIGYGTGETRPNIGGNGDFNDTRIDLGDVYYRNPTMYMTNLTSGVNTYEMTYEGYVSFLRNLDGATFGPFEHTWLGKVNPIDCIVSINYCPIQCTSPAQLYNIRLGSTDIIVDDKGGLITNRYSQLNFGSLLIEEYFGNFLDYEYTKISFYLPFVGLVPLDTHKVMNTCIEVKGILDNITGSITYYVYANKIGETTNLRRYLVGVYNGNCYTSIELSSIDYTTKVATIGSSIATTTASILATTVTGALAGGGVGAIPGAAIGAGVGAIGGITTIATKAATTSPDMLTAGTIAVGTPSILQALIQITRPKWVMPKDYDKLYGLPSCYKGTISECRGYNEVKQIYCKSSSGHVVVQDILSSEQDELFNILKSGFYYNKET